MKTFQIKTIEDHPLYVLGRTSLHQEDFAKFKRIKASPELSREEKNILMAREMIHAQEWESCMKFITEMSILKSEYLNAEMYALKAYLFQIFNQPEECLWANQRALFYYELCQDNEGLFRSHYNRAVNMEHFKLYKMMNFHYQEARKHATDPHQISHILKAEAFNSCRLKEYSNAKEKIEKALSMEEELEKTHFHNLKTVASEIYIKCGNLKKAKNFLKEVMASKINPERARVLSELRMLEILLEGGKMKIPPETVQKNRGWFLKWEILRNLQEGELEGGKALWQELSIVYPQAYGDNFQIFDEYEKQTAFGLLLEKTYQTKDTQKISSSLSKGEHLLSLLESSPIAMRKEDLIEKIWNCSYDPKFDARFYKLVQ
ncbi:MAG: hypothetical protein NXH75_10480, partial [Halobacteriovoraceae bacterium]|nr:hypothetical protein [Halobacteriovoraceae bacterium]